MKNRTRPNPEEYAIYYANYIGLVQGNDFMPALTSSDLKFNAVVGKLSQEQASKNYAEDKWNILDIVQHIIDTEWVFAYRALRFARNDKTDLPGFDHNMYVTRAYASDRKIEQLLGDLTALRASTIRLFESFNDDTLLFSGIANGNNTSVRALGWITAGHQIHHLNIIEERYLPVIL
jgi:hypothetical protein